MREIPWKEYQNMGVVVEKFRGLCKKQRRVFGVSWSKSAMMENGNGER